MTRLRPGGGGAKGGEDTRIQNSGTLVYFVQNFSSCKVGRQGEAKLRCV